MEFNVWIILSRLKIIKYGHYLISLNITTTDTEETLSVFLNRYVLHFEIR
jgi:hypothetical protein